METRREMNWESSDTERRTMRLLIFRERGLEKKSHMEKEKKSVR